MANSVKTKGVVLKGINFGEADKILTIFTERLGKIRVIAKGVRRIKSHLAGSLEPLMEVNLGLIEGKTFFIVTASLIIQDFPKIHSVLQKTSVAFYLGELIDRFSEEFEKNVEVYNLFSQALRLVEESDRSIVLRIFELKLISLSGFKPELYTCVHCKNKLLAGRNFWDGVEGGIICSECQKIHKHGREISDSAIKFFRYLTEKDFGEIIEKLKARAEILDETELILSDYLKHILERELKSSNFLKLINREYSAN
jgi:DNA repair protein RecO (recombination protein O)